MNEVKVEFEELGAFEEGVDQERTISFTVEEGGKDHRLDFWVSRELGISRAYAQKLIRAGRVVLSTGVRVKPSLKLEKGTSVTVFLPPVETLDLEPEPVPFDVLYEDTDIIVLTKPAGVVVHPAPGHWRGTLVHGLLYRFPELGTLNGVRRPGIVHRLDATTSGLMVVARNGLAQERLIHSFKNHEVQKVYLALVWGKPEPQRGEVVLPIGRDPFNRKRMGVVFDGKEACTRYETLWTRGSFSLVICYPQTGRTHQIRVHMKAIGCPLVGDTLYAPSRGFSHPFPRVFLHAWKLSFPHPRTGIPLFFRAPLSADLIQFLRELFAIMKDRQ